VLYVFIDETYFIYTNYTLKPYYYDVEKKFINLDRGHGDGHVQTLAVLGILHDGQAVATLHVLRRVLASGEKYGCNDVCCVSVESSDGTR